MHPISRQASNSRFSFSKFCLCAWLGLYQVVSQASPPEPDQKIFRSHALSLFAEPLYPAHFQHLNYVNTKAPKGGKLRLASLNRFDTLNPYSMKGVAPWIAEIPFHAMNEPLMAGGRGWAPSVDEQDVLYGLVARTVEYPESMSWVAFEINPAARFHDGHPIDAADVLFSYRVLTEKGHPGWAMSLGEVGDARILGPHKIRFDLERPGKDLMMRLAEMPVLPEHYWANKAFGATTMKPPLSSGPYRVSRVNPGRSVTLNRVRDYWARNLPINKGRWNFDQVVIDSYSDQTIAMEAFKSRQYDLRIEHVSRQWHKDYRFTEDNPRVNKVEIPHQRPANLQAFFFNTRRPNLNDIRVRQALGMLFDFEWANRALFFGTYTRTESWFPNSDYEAPDKPSDAEIEILNSIKPPLQAAIFGALPSHHGFLNTRWQKRRKALKLLEKAGWTHEKGLLVNAETGQPFTLEFLLSSPTMKRVVQPWRKALQGIGIQARIRLVDAAQYKNRLNNFNFDVTTFVFDQSPTPGLELVTRLHSSQASTAGSFNLAGIADPAVDQLLDIILAADNQDDHRSAVRTLDRVLLHQHYIVPHWYLKYDRVAYWDPIRRNPVSTPYAPGFDTWWYNDN
jgi:microcin C transport system substrate-binding protein